MGDDHLRRLLLDFDWLARRLADTDARRLVDAVPRLVQSAIRLAANILAKDKTELAGQLLGRLMAREEPEIQALLEQAKQWRGAAWLRPLTPSLTPPGEPLVDVWEGHTETINAVAVTTDGRWVVSGSWDQTLRIWELDSGTEVRTLKGHTGAVNAVAITPDRRLAISGSTDRTLKVWDLESGIELYTLRGHTEPVGAVAVTPDGSRVISGAWDKSVRVWDLTNGRQLRTMQGHTDRIESVAVTPDGRFAVSGSWDRTARIWDLERGKEVRTLKGHAMGVSALAVTHDGLWLVSGSGDCTVKVWNLKTGAEVRTLEGHRADVTALAVTAGGRYVISASYDHALKIWDLESGAEIRTLKGHTKPVKAVAATPGGRWAISGSDDLRVWDLASTADHGVLEAGSVVITADGRWAASRSSDGILRIWDVQNAAEIRRVPAPGHWGGALARTTAGRWVMVGSEQHVVKVRDLESGEVVRTLGSEIRAETAAVSVDGRRVMVGSADWGDDYLRAWDAESGRSLVASNAELIYAVAVSPDGRWGVSGGISVRVWDLDAGKQICTLKGGASALAVSPDGRWIVAGSDRNLTVWHRETAAKVWSLAAHTKTVSAVAVSGDGRRVVSGSHDKSVRVWERESGKAIAAFFVEAEVTGCAVAPDGSTILVTDLLGRMHFLRIESG